MTTSRIHWAFIAGLCAASASLFGKLTSLNELQHLFGIDNAILQICNGWLLRGIFAGFMVLCNAMVWNFFVKALHSSGGSVVATVCSAATNYFISTLFGCLFFGESTSLLWWTGTSLVLLGVVLITTDNETNDNAKNKKTS